MVHNRLRIPGDQEAEQLSRPAVWWRGLLWTKQQEFNTFDKDLSDKIHKQSFKQGLEATVFLVPSDILNVLDYSHGPTSRARIKTAR